MELTKKTIIDNIEDRTKDKENISAFESLGGTRISYKTFFEMVNNFAKGFKELGVENNDVVTISTAGTVDTLLYFFALNKIGATVQFVNPNFFKYNSQKYINKLNCKLFICLDRFYPLLKNSIEQTNLEKIIISSISEYSSHLYKILLKRKNIKKSDRIDGIEYIDFKDFIKLGENSKIKINRLPYEENKPAVICYTSGTTGEPKGVVHTNDSLNNMITIYEMAEGIGAKEGYRNLVLIPPMYLTSLVHEIITPMSLGSTNIMQPIYNPLTFGKDLKKYEPQATVGSKAHYLSLEKGKFKKNAFDFVKLAYCGGEAFSKASSLEINDCLAYYGIPPLIIGYGQTEFGTMVMFNNDIPFRTNEAGILLPEVKAKIIDVITGKEVSNNERGELYISTPSMMKEYLNNKEATENFFTTIDGVKYAKSGDIARIVGKYNNQDVYEVLGRKNDSIIENTDVTYLFDIENEIEKIKYVKTCEVVALTIDGKKQVVVHIILENNAQNLATDVLKVIDLTLKEKNNQVPYAYKIRDSFPTSVISGKRAYELLCFETDGYLKMDSDGEFKEIEIISEESFNNNNILKSKIKLS